MFARACANEMLMRLNRFLDEKFEFDYFRKTTQPFLMCFTLTEIFFSAKPIENIDHIFIKTTYLVSRTDFIHMLRQPELFCSKLSLIFDLFTLVHKMATVQSCCLV